jgi:hypothetical protein
VFCLLWINKLYPLISDKDLSEIIRSEITLQDSTDIAKIEIYPIGFSAVQCIDNMEWEIDGVREGCLVLIDVKGFWNQSRADGFFQQVVGVARRRQSGKEKEFYDRAEEKTIDLGLEGSDVKVIRMKPRGEFKRYISQFNPEIENDRWCSWIIMKYGPFVASIKPISWKVVDKEKGNRRSEGGHELWYLPERELLDIAVDLLHKFDSLLEKLEKYREIQ